MKTLLMLGGSPHQVHAIRRAVAMGLRVVTCDDRPDNPGHVFAHEYHEVSTTDLDGVLALAGRVGIDGVLAYASDPAALTAAYVADRLGLPGDPLGAVRRAQDKLRLREVQAAADLPVPEFVDAADRDAVRRLRQGHPDGIVVKPTDASGSRGVTVVPADASGADADAAVATALAASRSGRAVAEAFWGQGRPEHAGDALVVDGRIHYLGLLAKLLRQRPGAMPEPVGGGPPLFGPVESDAIRGQVQVLVDALGLRNGAYNFDLRVDGDGRFTIIDFGARMGGTLVGLLYEARDGIDLVGACIDLAIGVRRVPRATEPGSGHLSILRIQADRDGAFRELRLSKELAGMVIASQLAVQSGQAVRAYRDSGDLVGIMVLRSTDPGILSTIAMDPQRFFTVVMVGDAVLESDSHPFLLDDALSRPGP